MIKIEHLALWVNDLEATKDFYIHYFDMVCGEKYTNIQKQFTSYFLSFKGSKTRIELMHRPDILDHSQTKGMTNGLAHFAISVGSKAAVDALTERLRAVHHTIYGEARTT